VATEKLSDPEIAASFLNASLQESVEVFLSALGRWRRRTDVEGSEGVGGAAGDAVPFAVRAGNPTLETLTGVLSALDLKISM